jgi:hypothetical protein
MKKTRESSSNEKMYKCPLCAVMIPEETRDLKTCMECKQGSNFKQRYLSPFEIMFLK